MQSGRLQKLFLDKSKNSSEYKLTKSTGNSFLDKLRLERFSDVKEHNPKIEGGRKHTGFRLFDDINDERSDKLDFGDINDERGNTQGFEGCLLHPDNDAISRFFKRPKDDGSCLIATSSASSSVKAIIFPILFGNLSIFKQPDKSRVLRDSKLEMLLGRSIRILHPFKFSKTSFPKPPMDS
jgi:hypothetical protein